MITSKLFDPQDYKKKEYADIKRYFEGWWDVLQIEGIPFSYSDKNRAWEYAQIINSVPDWEGKNVLDLGTQMSLFPIYMYRVKNSNIVTFDIEFEKERERLYWESGIDPADTIHSIDIDKGDLMEELHYSREKFDIVTCFSVIEHLPTVDNAVAEMKRVCKKGGYICLTTDFAGALVEPGTVKSGSTYNHETLNELIKKFNLPFVGESDYHNVNLNRSENLAVDGKYTFASIVLQNI